MSNILADSDHAYSRVNGHKAHCACAVSRDQVVVGQK